MELAVSWKPLMYSKTSATISTAKTRPRLTECPSGILQHDGVDHVAGVAAAVDGFLDQLKQILAQNQARHVAGILEQVLVQTEDEAVGFALDRLHAVVERFHFFQLHAAAKLPDHLDDHRRRF